MTTARKHLHPKPRVATRVDLRSPVHGAPKGIARSTAAAEEQDISPIAIHEAAHAVAAREMGFEIETVSIRPGISHAGLTIAYSPQVDPTSLSEIPWWLNHPDLAPVVRRLHYLLAGNAAEAMATGTGRVAVPVADDARAAFEALPQAARTELLAAEAAVDGVSDNAAAWAQTVAFAGVADATLFFGLVAQGVRRFVSERLEAITAVAVELQRGSVLDGVAIDTILAVGELVEAEGGAPTSGSWTAIATFFVGDSEKPALVGETHVWHDARVQHAPQLFVSADTPSDAIQKAIDDYRIAAMSPEPIGTKPLRPGPGVARCIRHLLGRTRDGRLAINVARGTLLGNESWCVRRWPSYFAPSVA
jgi:hypothetical protein